MATDQTAAPPSAAAATPTSQATEIAVLAGGCFWGVEDILRAVPGVLDTDVGYTGGWLENPRYDDTHDSQSGHAESVRITFDPRVLSYETLLEQWFFKLHDPTTKNRQGNDVGTQYRSAVFYRTPAQKQALDAYLTGLRAAKVYRRPIVTQLAPLAAFHEAEAYHQGYLARHPDQPYIVFNDQPKLDALKKRYPALYRV